VGLQRQLSEMGKDPNFERCEQSGLVNIACGCLRMKQLVVGVGRKETRGKGTRGKETRDMMILSCSFTAFKIRFAAGTIYFI